MSGNEEKEVRGSFSKSSHATRSSQTKAAAASKICAHCGHDPEKDHLALKDALKKATEDNLKLRKKLKRLKSK